MTCFPRSYRQCSRTILIAVIIIIALITGCNAADEPQTSSALSCESSSSSSISQVEQELLTERMRQLAEVQELNSDSVAWLTIPGTDIDEVVVQSDENEYYLRRTAMGEKDIWGCYFADCFSNLESRQMLNTNTIIYGHSHSTEDPNERKFTQLFRFLDNDFLQKYQFIFLTLPQEELVFQVRAVFFTDIDFDYINPNPQGQVLEDFLTEVASKNEFLFDDRPLEENDKFLLLSTCAYRYDTKRSGNHRLVIMGKLLQNGASPIITQVKQNPTPERPFK